MKYTLFIITYLLAFSCQSPAEREVVTELDYFPEQHTEITDEVYRKWTTVLKSVYEKIEADSGDISYVGHLNIATSILFGSTKEFRIHGRIISNDL